jgi:hypothetical protein
MTHDSNARSLGSGGAPAGSMYPHAAICGPPACVAGSGTGVGDGCPGVSVSDESTAGGGAIWQSPAAATPGTTIRPVVTSAPVNSAHSVLATAETGFRTGGRT